MKTKLYYATEHRFVKVNGVYYGLGGFSISIWERYLEHFDELYIIARVSNDKNIAIDKGNIASCSGVKFIEIPYYIGLAEYLKVRSKINQVLIENVHDDGVFLCRLPGIIGTRLISILKQKNIPYSVEVVGDPWDVLAKGSLKHPIRPFLRLISTIRLKLQVRSAQAALYVTEQTLQKRYPIKKNRFSIGVSDVIIKDDLLANKPKIMSYKDIYTIISVGTLDQLYKAPDVVLKSIKIVKDKGFKCRLIWLGDGKYRSQLIDMSKELGIEDYVNFIGSVPGSLVNQYLKEADIFVLVSRTEGLPRAILEAMGQGLPCIGSKVGGIPELLSSDNLVRKDRPDELADVIIKMLSDYNFANNSSSANLKKASMYTVNILNEKRNLFFTKIKSIKYT